MKAIIFLLVGVVAAGVVPTVEHDANTSTVLLPEPYTAIPFSMEGAIEPGGKPMTFNGTVTDIFSQIQAIKPDFKWDDFQPVAPLIKSKRDMLKRDKASIYHLAWKLPVLTSLTGLHPLQCSQQRDGVAGGPHKCAMVWCDSKASIWFCNGNTDGVTKDCSDLASYVLDVMGDVDCVYGLIDGDIGAEIMAQMKGMEFDTEDWGILLRSGSC
ncbi:hypothetical protein M434DRAFT_15487 [Hypoxylon sp. CO27-5]|nr:hypothetical protein M434DRAFT_15487 [Hypoxylon sp. CO27-5]